MRRLPMFTAALAASALLLSGCAGPSETNMVGGIRDPFVISTYGTGTSTYQDTAAVSDAVSQATGSRVRIITSDTAIGRMAAMKSGAAAMGRLGDEYIFAYEGLNEFANEDWGPQDTRGRAGRRCPRTPSSRGPRTASRLPRISRARRSRRSLRIRPSTARSTPTWPTAASRAMT